MQKLYILLLFIVYAISTQAQDAKDILIKSFNKCQSINGGHFKVNSEQNATNNNNKYIYKINFRKTPNDTVATCLYNAQIVGNKNNYGNIIHNGKSYITYNTPVTISYSNSYESNTNWLFPGNNWLFPSNITSYNGASNFSSVNYPADWFYRGLYTPTGLFADYRNGNSWQTTSDWSSYNQGEIIPTSKYGHVVKQKCFNDVFMFYEPIMARKSALLPNYAALSDSNTVLEFVNIETLNGYKCWHVKAVKTVNNDTLTTDAKALYTTNYWINMRDSIPVKFSITKESLPNGKIIFVKQYAITDYNFDTPKEDWYFSEARVPKEINLKRYVAKTEKKR